MKEERKKAERNTKEERKYEGRNENLNKTERIKGEREREVGHDMIYDMIHI
jgi:hypothetical protein